MILSVKLGGNLRKWALHSLKHESMHGHQSSPWRQGRAASCLISTGMPATTKYTSVAIVASRWLAHPSRSPVNSARGIGWHQSHTHLIAHHDERGVAAPVPIVECTELASQEVLGGLLVGLIHALR